MLRPFYALSLISVLTGSLKAQEQAAADPLITERSGETFQADLGGLLLTLPIELKDRLEASPATSRNQGFSLGNIDISFDRKSTIAPDAKPIKGWIEFETLKQTCSSKQELESLKKNIRQYPGYDVHIRRVSRPTFAGYILKIEQSNSGIIKGINYELIDTRQQECFHLSLAIADFDGFSKTEIKRALSPLTKLLDASLLNHTH